MSETGKDLNVSGLEAGYGESTVIESATFSVPSGQVVTLLGRNGVGKTTILRSLMGLGTYRAGDVLYGGENIGGLAPRSIARHGIAYCPEERGIFASLNVEENLLLPPVLAPGGLTLEEIFELFPNLKERIRAQGTKLSGGEQQMLAIGRILRTGAKLLLLDEPTEGLAPVIVEKIGIALNQLRDRGFTILLVEQNLGFAVDLADRHYVVDTGEIVATYSSDQAARSLGEIKDYLEI